VKAKDGILHIRIEKSLRARAVKKAEKTKRTLSAYVCELIEADTARKSRREKSSEPGAVQRPAPVPGNS
jgi:hypothetical protein